MFSGVLTTPLLKPCELFTGSCAFQPGSFLPAQKRLELTICILAELALPFEPALVLTPPLRELYRA